MACKRCNRKKIKCSGGDSSRGFPCRHCLAASAECVYPTRERHITVSESYLRALEDTIKQFNGPSPGATLPTSTVAEPPVQNPERSSSTRFIENTTAEAFVSRLRKLGTQRRTDPNFLNANDDESSNVESLEPGNTAPYKYFSLKSDRQATNITLKLPPYPYAVHLVEQFESYVGYEYHWFLRKSFREQLESTYANPLSEKSKDRVWLCRLLVVLALGETYVSRMAPWIDLSDDGTLHHPGHSAAATRPPPGVGFFEQAMAIFQMPYEEPTTDHIEALNLIAFYSYSLDRRRSAFIYAGLSMRIACSLMLHNPSARAASNPCHSEHCRRLWWTTYQIDAMTGSEMGINSTFDFDEIEAKLGLPGDNGLTLEDQSEFGACTILNAHIRLCSIRSGILSAANTGLSDANSDQLETNLSRPISVLEQWRASLPDTLNFDFSGGIPPAMVSMQECRSLASLYLRFYHCFILLIRPVVLRLISVAVTQEPDASSHSGLDQLCDRCENAARYNLNILIGLWQIDKIAKFGFWESLHLFSSIKILLMTNIGHSIRPSETIYRDLEDDILYQNSKLLLHEMANAGNMTTQGHIGLVEDLERIRSLIIERVQSDTAERMVLPDMDLDLDHWLATLNASPSNVMIPC